MSEAASVVQQACEPACAPKARPTATGAAAPNRGKLGLHGDRNVPCSMLGVKEVHPARTMGPPSGAVLVSPSQRLKPHAMEPVLPQRASCRGRA